MTVAKLKQIPYLDDDEKDAAEKQVLLDWIYAIEDALTRKIFIYRYVNSCTWPTVASRLGGGNTCEGVRKRHNRYLRDN